MATELYEATLSARKSATHWYTKICAAKKALNDVYTAINSVSASEKISEDYRQVRLTDLYKKVERFNGMIKQYEKALETKLLDIKNILDGHYNKNLQQAY